MLQIVASLTDDTRSVNYDRNTFIIQATDHIFNDCKKFERHILNLNWGGIHILYNTTIILQYLKQKANFKSPDNF